MRFAVVVALLLLLLVEPSFQKPPKKKVCVVCSCAGVSVHRRRRRLPRLLCLSPVQQAWRARRRICEASACAHLPELENDNCVNNCVSPACFDSVYGQEPVRIQATPWRTALRHAATSTRLLLPASAVAAAAGARGGRRRPSSGVHQVRACRGVAAPRCSRCCGDRRRR
jgi:hypothetical protein